jgi:hypothetical protein
MQSDRSPTELIPLNSQCDKIVHYILLDLLAHGCDHLNLVVATF